ncbi:MAG: SPFH domain-containing protein [Myxococcales bacterium]|nr:SPFH domain-containing protein [Myxococcales bacterium]
MGIFDFVKQGVRDMSIARPESAKALPIYKHPDQTIPMKAQLTVMADEIAFFYKDGTLVGQIGPGRHTLETSNIPFLDIIVDKFTGGNVLKAEVWFVTMREIAGLKFGGRIGAQEDPKSGVPVETMVHGDYSIQVNDATKFIAFFGLRAIASEDEFTGWFRNQVLKVIRDRIAELLVKKKWPLLDVTSGAYTEEIEEDVILGVKKHLASYGVDVVRLGNFEISIGEEDGKNLKKLYTDAAYIRMSGGMAGYQQFAAGKAMMGAGEGMAKGGGEGGGGGMLAGAGLGVGVGMANMFNQQQHPPPQAPQAPQAPAGAGQVTCGACNKLVAAGKFCAECGQTLAPAKAFCANCGQQMAAGSKFCPGCGSKTA